MQLPFRIALASLLMLGLAASAPPADAADTPALEPFVGDFIGVANSVEIDTGEVEERDLAIEIKPYSGGGVMIEWETVFKVDGRRDVPGVKRRSTQLIFEPADHGRFFVEIPRADPFRRKKEFDPLAGDSVRWARIEGRSLKVYSVTVRDDGRFELEIYDRARTEQGLKISFQRMLDGTVVRRVTGRAVESE